MHYALSWRTHCWRCLRRLSSSAVPAIRGGSARFCSLWCLDAAAEAQAVEAAFDAGRIFYGDAGGQSQLSGCIALAYRAVVQRPLAFFR